MHSVGQTFHDPSGAFNEVIRSGKRKHNEWSEKILDQTLVLAAKLEKGISRQ